MSDNIPDHKAEEDQDLKQAGDDMEGTSEPMIIPKMIYEAGKVEVKKAGRAIMDRYDRYKENR